MQVNLRSHPPGGRALMAAHLLQRCAYVFDDYGDVGASAEKEDDRRVHHRKGAHIEQILIHPIDVIPHERIGLARQRYAVDECMRKQIVSEDKAYPRRTLFPATSTRANHFLSSIRLTKIRRVVPTAAALENEKLRTTVGSALQCRKMTHYCR